MIHSDSLQYRLDEEPMAPKKVPTTAELKKLARAHTRAEDALRQAELKVLVAKRAKPTSKVKRR